MTKKKRYIVVPRTEAIKESGLRTGKRKLNFGQKTARWIDDPAEAREIDQRYGNKGTGEVWVEQDENLEWHAANDNQTDGRKLGIHHYTFAQMGVSLPDRRELLKKVKTVNGTKYRYVEQSGKMKLVALAAESGKRERSKTKVSKASAAA